MDVVDGNMAFIDKFAEENDDIKYRTVCICIFSDQC